MSGTPKTLIAAITNGLRMAGSASDIGKAAAVEIHVRDFLAQKFTIEMMDNPSVASLWNQIFVEHPVAEDRKPTGDAL